METDQWIAWNDEFAGRETSELLAEAFLPVYERLFEDCYRRILKLHCTLRTLEQMEGFPFLWLLGPDRREFWTLVAENFVSAMVVDLHSLVNDQRKDVSTLKRLRNRLGRPESWRDSEQRDRFIRLLKERKFDAETHDVVGRITDLRHSRVAHVSVESDGRPKGVGENISLEEFRFCFDSVHRLFGALTLGMARCTLTDNLSLDGTGVDRVLDAVVRDSKAVNAPERCPWFWDGTLPHMTDQDLSSLNSLRRRIGLPEVLR